MPRSGVVEDKRNRIRYSFKLDLALCPQAGKILANEVAELVPNVRAIDLYAGMGGWSLGLRLAGVELVASYEWWKPAIDTHNGNHGGDLKPVDIRKLALSDLPTEIDLVVGSPPCTQFSYSNRGGRGDVSEGLKDLVKFFEVVDHLKPKIWAMENVPRVAEVLASGFRTPEHPLYRFRHLMPRIEVIDFSDYGTPQARKRCIAGNFDFDLLFSYQASLAEKTLGDVIQSLSTEGRVIDPVWRRELKASQLTDTQEEPALNGEELRMNRDSKLFHPVYNNMAFPDSLGQPARTVTATCTRVSRESIVISDPRRAGSFRRLTIRERASLQGFPITYQFFARSFAEKAKMIGNAIPPTFTYLLAQAAKGVPADAVPTFEQVGRMLELPKDKAPVTPPDKEGKTYPATRGFRAALPHLRFKSGMRFELANVIADHGAAWEVRFFFGTSKDVRSIDLDGSTLSDLRDTPFGAAMDRLKAALIEAESELMRSGPVDLQAVWTRRKEGRSPFALVDQLGELSDQLFLQFPNDPAALNAARQYVVLLADQADGDGVAPGRAKLERNAVRILSGFLIGDWFNSLPWHRRFLVAA
ncbi:MAG: DNA (cytosine-5-)-methyltransferase [Caulobacter sp.]|nr:DNA (cytosine-5-)-methyltransferase [Caulobacter sp.]